MHSNTESLQADFNGTDVYFKTHITSKYQFFVIEFNIILMTLIFTLKCCIYSEYKELIHDISGSTSVPRSLCIIQIYML